MFCISVLVGFECGVTSSITNSSFIREFDQRWDIYFSNPRAVSFFLTRRVYSYSSKPYHFSAKTEPGSASSNLQQLPAARWMSGLFPKQIYTNPRGQAANRYVAFIMPPALSIRKFDGFRRLWTITHDARVTPVVRKTKIIECNVSS